MNYDGISNAPAALVCAAIGDCASTSGAPGEAARLLVITHADSRQTTLGSADYFTGSVTITPLFGATQDTRAAGASVSFEPGARTAWHSHPAGQTLIVTAGTGWVQQWGGQKQEVKAGDVIWTPPGVKHWHGATTDTAMTHIAIQEHVEGKVVDWMEHVSDEQYVGH